MRDFGALLERFPEVRTETGGNYVVRCPAHHDRHPSLVLALKTDGRIILHCRAGCTTDSVLARLGMRPRDLFGWTAPAGVETVNMVAQPAPVGVAEIAALATYVDATSRALWEQESEHARAACEWLGARHGLDLPRAREIGVGVDYGNPNRFPYISTRFANHPRLTVPLWDFEGTPRGLQGRDISGNCSARWMGLTNPETSKWARYGYFRGDAWEDTCLVVEGPSDALTAYAAGYGACFVRGASLADDTLADELAAGLRGHHVCIAADTDPAGERFRDRLAAALHSRGIPVHLVRVPFPDSDLTDWRERDPGTFDDALHRAVRDAEVWEPPAEDTTEGPAGDTDMVTREDGMRAADLLTQYTERYGDTDAMRAHALVAFADGRIRYATGLGYYVWNGRVWEQSDTRVRQEVHRMGAALALAGKTAEAKGFLNTSRIDALIRELRAVPAVCVDADAFDTREELLSVRNGTVDLRTGALRPHDKRDMITRYVDLDYRSDAECPRWESFLEELFPDNPELPGYLRRLIGYGITGSTAEQCFAVLWGQGANGKSVFMDTLTHVFAAVSKTTPFATFEERPNGGIPNDLAALRGARLVRASEGEQGKPMAESVLKRATGSDKMSARFLRQEFFEFTPTFLLLMDTNHKPKFKGQDEGIWRRVKMVPFARYFAPHERDHALGRKLRAEAPGILAWAVRGAREWYAHGLEDPEIIRDATQEYRETSDALMGFFPGVLERGEDTDKILGSDAFNRYLEWCEAENLPQRERWTRRGFYAAMEERKILRKRTMHGIALFGVRLANTSSVGTHNPSDQIAHTTSSDIFGQQR